MALVVVVLIYHVVSLASVDAVLFLALQFAGVVAKKERLVPVRHALRFRASAVAQVVRRWFCADQMTLPRQIPGLGGL